MFRFMAVVIFLVLRWGMTMFYNLFYLIVSLSYDLFLFSLLTLPLNHLVTILHKKFCLFHITITLWYFNQAPKSLFHTRGFLWDYHSDANNKTTLCLYLLQMWHWITTLVKSISWNYWSIVVDLFIFLCYIQTIQFIYLYITYVESSLPCTIAPNYTRCLWLLTSSIKFIL